MPANNPQDGDLVLEEDDPHAPADAAAAPAPWRILIVDDDVDVHVVTKFALSHASYHNRGLSFLHAYSGKEAIELLRSNGDIAMVLLDVIMETDDAGLKVARAIRSELGNDLVRIVLRTGQPGQALEHAIIVDYDINDFWCKADLTTRKLFTTVIASLRAYDTLKAAAETRDALKRQLEQARHVQEAVNRHALVLTLDAHGLIVDANDRLCQLMQTTAAELAGRDLHALHQHPYPQPLAGDIAAALARDGGWAGDLHTATPEGRPLDLRCAVLSFRDPAGKPYRYIGVATPL
jgi:CheY-like chemotaxis protein